MPDTLASFVLEEDISSDPLRVEFAGSDLPQGRPRDYPAFNSGSELKHEEIELPGRTTPIVQVRRARARDMILKGSFRDHLAIGRDGVPAGTQHARGMRDAIEALLQRANPLRITWAGETRIGLLKETNFGEESDSQISYELTFLVLRPPQSTNDPGQRNQQQDTADVAAQMRASVAAQRAQLAAVAGVMVANAIVAQATHALDEVDSGLATTLAAAITMEGSPKSSIVAAAQRVIAAVGTAQAACATAQALIGTTTLDQAVPFGDATAGSQWTAAQLGTLDLLTLLVDQLRTVAAGARAKLRTTIRLYVVREGDTPESIAARTMGDPSRAGDLGVRADQLYPGLVIRIPDKAA